MINDGTPEYRFAPPGPRDEPKIVAWCAWCGGEIYAGDSLTAYASGDRTHGGHCENEYVRAELGINRIVAD